MNVSITIKYSSPAGVVMQRGSFPLRGKTPEQVVISWWKQIKREVFAEKLVEVILDGEDITEKIKPLL